MSFHTVIAVWVMLFTMTSIAMLFIMPITSAHSMMVTADPLIYHQTLYDVKSLRKNRKNSSPSVLAPVLSDPCLSLLHSGHAPSKGAFASNRSSLNSAQFLSNGRTGTSAALTFMLGVRFSMDSHKKSNTRLKDAVKADLQVQFSGNAVGQDIPRTTLSIGAYRHCKKEMALKASRNK